MKSFEFTGKNIEKAIENGLKNLNKKREDVDISIISEGGLFSKAKVIISYEEENLEEEVKDIIENEEKSCAHEECKNECECENCNDECNNECSCSDECCDCECDCDCDCECGEECNCECDEECNCECACDEECSCGCNEEDNEEKNNDKPQREYMTSEQVIEKIQEIFSNIFKALNLDAKAMVLENDEAFEVKIMGGENVSCLIGYRGEGLNAYQLLINNFIELRNKPKKILIDVENYRNRREESLRGLAQRIAKKVLKTKRSHKFEPMTAYERHVIHEELSNFKGVTTHSEGVEPHRCLIVELEK